MKVLVVGLGSRGGIGRYEHLLKAGLDELASQGSLEWRGVWRHAHPTYLDPQSRTVEVPPDGSVLSLLQSVSRTTRHWRPDVVYFTHVNLARAAPLLPLLGIRAPYVVGTLGVEVWERLRWTKRLPLRRAASVLAISEYTRARVVGVQGVPEARCKTIHLALEEHWVTTADRLRAEANGARSPAPCSLLSVCRLERDDRYKGVDWVLRAIAELAPAHPDLRYTVVGDGDDLLYLRGLAAELGLQQRVTFTGALDHDDLLAAYRDADLFVLPTRREGFGLVFLEAMAFRKPIIAAAAAGAVDVVSSGEHGLLIDGEDELAAAIATLLRDRDLAKRMGEAGYRAVTETFSFDAFVSRLWALLRGSPAGAA